MPVISCEKVSTRVAGEAGGHRTYTSIWQVITDDVNDGASTARMAEALPNYGDTYAWGNSYDTGAWVQAAHSATLKNEQANRKVWNVTVVHSSRGRSSESESSSDDPLDAPWEVTGDGDEWVEEAQNDINGKAITNSAKRPITGKAVERIRTRRKFTLTKNFEKISPGIEYLESSINSSTVRLCGGTYAPYTLKMRRIGFQRLWVGNSQRYYRVTFYVDVNPDTHFLKIVDTGRHEYKAGDRSDPKSYVEITDSDTRNPQPDGSYYLDGNGGVLNLLNGEPVILNGPNGFQVDYAREWNIVDWPRD